MFRGVLEEVPSFASRLGKGVGSGISNATDMAIKLRGSRAKEDATKQAALTKAKKNSAKYVAGEVKAGRFKDIFHDADRDELSQEYNKLLDQGVDDIDQAHENYNLRRQQQSQERGPQQESNWMQELGMPPALTLADKFFRSGIGNLKKPTEPFSKEKALNIMGSAFNPIKEAVKESPLKAAGSTGLGTISPIDQLMEYLDPVKTAAKLTGTAPKNPKLATDMVRDLLTKGLTEEQKRGHSQLELLGGLLPAEEFLALFKGAKGIKAINPSEILAAERPLGLTHKPGAAKAAETLGPEAERSLAGRVGKQELTPTEMRVSRTKPEQRVYPRSTNVAIREAQVKSFPKYEAEIAQDAAERAERAASRIPKTVKGMDSKRLRIHEAEKKWPLAQDSYNKAAGRVRALEDEVGKLRGEARQEAQKVLDLAVKDLEDATFQLKQSFENRTGTNVRAGAPAMRDAARNKIAQIQDAIANGEEYKIAKMDYSPDLIAKAKVIAKKAPIPKTRASDFYTQVHDIYAGEYKTRLGEIEKEIHNLPRNMAGLSRGRELELEKGILNKMVESAGAEKTIQNRRFGLREMSERKKASERFAGLRQAESNPKVAKAANEKMWKERVHEIKTPEGRAKIADEVIEEAAQSARTPEIAEKIRGEKSEFIKAQEQLAKETQKVKLPPKAPTAKGVVHQAKGFFRDYKAQIDEFKKSMPYFWNSQIGQDVIKGILGALWDDVRKEIDVPITSGSVASLIWGNKRGSGTRFLTNQLVKWALSEFHLANAKRAYEGTRSGNRSSIEKFQRFSPSMQKKAKESARESLLR